MATEARTCASPSPTQRGAPRRTRDDLAKLTGLGYVGNILELLRLHPSILEAIERLPVGTGNEVTERWLRPIARLPHDEQLTAVAERLNLGVEEDCGCWAR